MLFRNFTPEMVTADRALPGRDTPVLAPIPKHLAYGIPLDEVPEGSEVAYFGMGCFWGAERLYWLTDGVTNTGVGYQGGFTPNPTYEEVCSGRTGDAEVVKVAYDPNRVSFEELLKVFFENHNPTQGMRQGNDVGTQYRSLILTTTPEQFATAERVRDLYQQRFTDAGFGTITTEIVEASPFYWAEDYHQQYLIKNPGGYCNHGPNGVSCPVGVLRQDQVPSQESVLGREE
ncbi:peptide-methionine (S)-S-oxide reductase MsrA [Naumannella cuiyingiana]|uniref:Peptide methionine sulfoxide reductase MsrA n=1 Tax=Naumannella cuiyingiana TaxID=1347891 RepID=A0A7Z0ILP1_9ACTN|nr:peptide-methionine (S)-S-oxide reductase MsrA [Naumannella cuiyingiana]NYI71825.1 peptide-methionine (S)-S-oxide reductase [Naumannella cuiyingiana]